MAFMAWHGFDPFGFVVDHLCENRRCVNPLHLRATTDGVNIAYSHKECPNGHPYSGDASPSKGRRCRICQRANWRRKEARKRDRRYLG